MHLGVDAGNSKTAALSPMADALFRELAHHMPLARPTVSTMPPVAGAALDAIAELARHSQTTPWPR